MRKKRYFIFTIFLWLFISFPVLATDITLVWKANPELFIRGYKLYYDIDSGPPYDGTTLMGGAQENNSPVVIWLNGKKPLNKPDDLELLDNDNPEITVTGFDLSVQWFFVVNAFDMLKEGGYSNEVATESPDPTMIWITELPGDIDIPMTKSFEIIEPGNYTVWGYVIAPDGGSNSFLLSMDGSTDQIWDLPHTTTWVWDQVNAREGTDPTVFNLDIGSHVLNIKVREIGSRLNKILITNSTHDPKIQPPVSVYIIRMSN